MLYSYKKWLGRGLLALLLPLPLACKAPSVSEPLKSGAAWVYEVSGEFEDVRDDLVDAIESEGMVISYISHAQAMLSRTAITVDAAENIYRDAEVVLFCQAARAHRLVVANPHNLVLCPYAVAVYTLEGESGHAYLAIRGPEPGVPEFDEVHQMLQDLVISVQSN